MRTEAIEMKRDGFILRGFQSLPETEYYDIAILFHGFMKTCGRYPEDLIYQMSEELNRRGIGTVRVDFAGQGESDGQTGDMSVLSEILDAEAILRYVRSLPGVRRIFVHGQSQGGVIAAMTAGLYPDKISKAALTAPAAVLVDDAKQGQAFGITFDPREVPDTIPINGQDYSGFYFRTNQKLNIYEWAAAYDGPAIIVHCEKDQIVPCRYAERFHEVMKNSELHILPGGNHAMEDGVREETLRLVGEFFEK